MWKIKLSSSFFSAMEIGCHKTLKTSQNLQPFCEGLETLLDYSDNLTNSSKVCSRSIWRSALPNGMTDVKPNAGEVAGKLLPITICSV